jgi:hypothetical protein
MHSKGTRTQTLQPIHGLQATRRCSGNCDTDTDCGSALNLHIHWS